MPISILHVTADYAPLSKGGGVERYIHNLAVECMVRSHQVTVAARSIDKHHAASYRTVRANRWRLFREIRAADCVHIHGPRSVEAAVAGMMALCTGTPFFYTAHCFYRGKTRRQIIHKFIWDHLVERLLFACARRVILLSNYWRHDAQDRYLPTSRITLLPNGINVAELQSETYAPLTIPGNPAILSVSRLDPIKRLDDAIAVLTQPAMEAAHLHIVGCGNDEARLRDYAATCNVAERVTFHGFQPDARIAALARAAQLFVIASAEEGMPTTILEMFARQLPVVASAIPGNLSLTDALHWPHTYPLGDVATLAATIQRARAEPISGVMLQQLRDQFDWRTIADAMLVLYGDR